jgi:hypothetical protein
MAGGVGVMTNKKDRHDADDSEQLYVEDLLKMMSMQEYPPFIERLLSQMQGFMWGFVSDGDEVKRIEDLASEGYDLDDPQYMLEQLAWVKEYADLVAPEIEECNHEEAVILSFTPVDNEEAIRWAIDHAALFARDICRRIWIIGENWDLSEVLQYSKHMKALAEIGVSLRFLLLTPWGWAEVPLFKEVSSDEKRGLLWKGKLRRRNNNLPKSNDDSKTP